MTTETIPNENVQAVLDHLDELTDKQTELTYHSGDYMDVKIDLRRTGGEATAGLIEWHIDRGWSLDCLDMVSGVAEMSGSAYDVE
jgi:hypothetical protein